LFQEYTNSRTQEYWVCFVSLQSLVFSP
jgi:hypothetical protein